MSGLQGKNVNRVFFNGDVETYELYGSKTVLRDNQEAMAKPRGMGDGHAKCRPESHIFN